MSMKAWSLLKADKVEESGDGYMVVRGMATTPTPDRVGDIVEPLGMLQRSDINLHLYHSHEKPVGNVNFGKALRRGVPFEAMIPDVVEEGVVRERVNEARHSLKYKLLKAVSIGFRGIEGAVERLSSGALRFKEWEILELSLVSVPANHEAVITAFKSADAAAIRGALGVESDGYRERAALVKSLCNGGIPLVNVKAAPVDLAGAVRLKF